MTSELDLKRCWYDPSDRQQRKAVIDLLCEAFGVYVPYYEAQLDLVGGEGSTYLYYTSDGDLVAHIQAVPYEAVTVNGQSLRVAYLYAICTASRCQGRGVMTQVLSGVLDLLSGEGYDLAALVPAEISLIDYYRKFGFMLMVGDILWDTKRRMRPIVWPGKEAQAFNRRAYELDMQLYGRSEPKEMVGWMLHPLATIDSPLPISTPIMTPML